MTIQESINEFPSLLLKQQFKGCANGEKSTEFLINLKYNSHSKVILPVTWQLLRHSNWCNSLKK